MRGGDYTSATPSMRGDVASQYLSTFAACNRDAFWGILALRQSDSLRISVFMFNNEESYLWVKLDVVHNLKN